jgi:predicted dehydrogenase
MNTNRRDFIKKSVLAGAAMSFSASSYAKIIGSNDRVRVGVLGFSDRFKNSLLPAFMNHNKELNYEIVGISDLWKIRREEGLAHLRGKFGNGIKEYMNNEQLLDSKTTDAVIISTADFQHAIHTVQALQANQDVYAEKPLAETMEDARGVLKEAQQSGKVVQIGSQRRSGPNYHEAAKFIKDGKFGPIVMVELMWNVNQPGRWRRPDLVAKCKQEDLDWTKYQLNRPKTAFDPRKYLEYRLFWPYSSGIPGQWMSHQIDTVHWFSGLGHPRSATANGGIYQWKDGRTNPDTFAVTFDYGPADDMSQGFQVLFQSRFSNSAGGTKELYYSNGGMINLDTNEITSEGGLTKRFAGDMGMRPNLLDNQKLSGLKVEAGANTGGDPLTSAHMRNWMECVRSRAKTNGPIEAGYQHSIANIMATAAYRTGLKVTFDEKTQEVMAGGKPFKYGDIG